MTFEYKKPEDEEEEGTEGMPVSSAPGLMTAGGTPEQATQVKQDVTPGAGITDINKYLDVNREKVQRLGEKVGGVIQGDINQARTGLEGAGTQFKEDVAKGTVNLDQDLFNRAQTALTNQAGYQSGQAGSFLGTAEDVDRFKKLYGAQYGGPQDLASQQYYTPALQDANKAIRTSGLVGSTEGREELVARAAPSEQGRYSKGALTLDQALLASDVGTMQNLQGIAGGSDIADRLAALKSMSAEEVLKGQQTSASTKEAMQKEFNLGREEQEIASEAERVKQKAMADYLAKLAEIKKMKPQEGLNPESYYSLGKVEDINKYNVATQGDYERLKALQELTGINSTLLPFEAQAGQSNQFLDPSGAFNLSKYNADVAANKEARLKQEKLQADYLAAQEAASAEAKKRQKEAEYQQTGTMVGASVGIAVGSVVGGPVGAVIGGTIGGAIGGAIGGSYKKWCFDPKCEFEMADGSYKMISNISMGDIMKDGGEVLRPSAHINHQPMYAYPTSRGVIYVTGDHAVHENNEWIRVKNSKIAELSNHKSEVVITLSNKNHKMVTGGVTFSDYQEIDNDFGLDDKECLEILRSK